MLIDQFKGGDVKVISDSFAAVFKTVDTAQDDQGNPGRENFAERSSKTISIAQYVQH